MGIDIFRRLLRMKAADKLVILISTLAIVSVFTFLFVFYFSKPTIPNSNRSSLSLDAPKRAPAVLAVQTVKGSPELLSIPSLGLNLNVIPGTEDKNGNWTLTWDKVQYATVSTEPNNSGGDTLIYGHESKGVFLTLFLLKKGDTASVQTDNGYIFHYKYEGTYAVNPHDVSIFDYQGPPILTLQTCSGVFFQNRQMYQFSYVGFDKTK